ncbi:Wilms tumor protein 1-interacting protein isoform X2 [Dromiciops gliroides]|uniref:Wilms tumor protein 1-interacting protein isoform X2 n=1 Tax=Dromiciops gliroides TaxID=33562 RepID=UPI001CC7DB59|nr:Wilms tumor protein 1-interacting protein isoform X2 [Dromiciops gliroides]
MQRSQADAAALLRASRLLADLSLAEPGADGWCRGRPGQRPTAPEEAAPARSWRVDGGGCPEPGGFLERCQRRTAYEGPGARLVAPSSEPSAKAAGSSRGASLADSEGFGSRPCSTRTSGISLGYDQRHGSPRSSCSDPRGPGPPEQPHDAASPGLARLGTAPARPAWCGGPGAGGSARSSVSSLSSRGSAGAYADLLLLPPPAPPPSASAGHAQPAAGARLQLPFQVTTGQEGGLSPAERRLEALTLELERELDLRTKKEYFGRRLRGKAFYNVAGKVYCEEDFLYSGFQQTADKCFVCGHLIMEMILQALGKSYHPGCFRCVVCNECLDGVPFTVDVENNIYCVKDYHTVFAPKCASCTRPILPEKGCEETIRVVSMDKDYHVECYHCEDCGLRLNDQEGRRCYPLEGHLLCRSCHMGRLPTPTLTNYTMHMTEL